MPPTRCACAASRSPSRCASARSRRPGAPRATTSRSAPSSASARRRVSANVLTDPAELAERAVAMAKVAPEDPYAGLADPARLAREFPDLDLLDASIPSAAELTEIGAGRRGCRPRRSRRHQFRRRQRRLVARRPGARHLARLRRLLSHLALQPLGLGDRRRGHRHGARLRGRDRRSIAPISSARRGSAARPASAPCAASIRRKVADRPRHGRLRPAGRRPASSAISPAPINGAAIARKTSFLKRQARRAASSSETIQITDDPTAPARPRLASLRRRRRRRRSRST